MRQYSDYACNNYSAALTVFVNLTGNHIMWARCASSQCDYL